MSALWADLIVIGHFFYVSFTIGGEILIILGWILKWHWIGNAAFRIIHLIAVLFVAVEAIFGAICPLTEWEYNLRVLAGQTVERELSFIARLVRAVIFYEFPIWVFTAMYIGFGVLVGITMILIPPRRLKKV
ncbi:hypothetical protein ES703_18446 [subsurface metagenome]